MRFLLDTCICIDLMRGKGKGTFTRLRRLQLDETGISSITLAELYYGAAKSNRPAYHESLIVSFCAPIAIAPFNSVAAEVYGGVRAGLEKSGKPIGPLDLLIASHAIALGATVITSNLKEFRRVTGLRVEDWR